MRKYLVNLVLIAVLLLSTSGCVAVVAGAAGGAGTAFWMEGKIKEEIKAPMSKVTEATTSALKAMKLEITKTTVKDEVAQIMSKYSDGRVIWIDVKKISENSCELAIRVGVRGDKEASLKILNKIKRYL